MCPTGLELVGQLESRQMPSADGAVSTKKSSSLRVLPRKEPGGCGKPDPDQRQQARVGFFAQHTQEPQHRLMQAAVEHDLCGIFNGRARSCLP